MALVQGLPNNPIPQDTDIARFMPLTKIAPTEDRETAIRALDLLQPVDFTEFEEHRRICPICLGDYREDTNAQDTDQDESSDQAGPAVSLPCTHIMCSTCATEWIKRYGTCPQPWCSAVFLISRTFAASLSTQSRLAAGKLHTKSTADRAFTLFRYRDFIKKSWHEERASYIHSLTTLPTKANDDEPAAIALKFIERHTLPDIAPDPAARFVMQHVVQVPALLADRRFAAARYVKRKERERGVVMWEVLAECVIRDVVAERKREAAKDKAAKDEAAKREATRQEEAKEVVERDAVRVDTPTQRTANAVRDPRLELGNFDGGVGGMVLAAGAVGAIVLLRVFR